MASVTALSTISLASPDTIELQYQTPRPSSTIHSNVSSAHQPVSQHESTAQAPDSEPKLTLLSALVILTLAAVTFACSMSTGLVTVALPAIQTDLALAPSLILWPGAVYSLAMGCCLMLAGSVADMIGNRPVQLCGSFVLAVTSVACGRAASGIQLIIFRALQGIGAALCFPSGTSIVTNTFAQGKLRNVAFSVLGLGQPLGYQVGLSLGGVFVDSSVSWRFGFYLCGGITAVFAVLGGLCLPADKPRETLTLERLAKEIDWVGVVLSSACFGLLTYFLGIITSSTAAIHQAGNIAILVTAILLGPAFVLWMRIREKQGKTALIPNSIWRKATFPTICIVVLLVEAVLNSTEYTMSLYYQQIQHISALQTSLRYLPNVIWGILVNIMTGQLVSRVSTSWYVAVMAVLSTVAPLLLALNNPEWSWWRCLFWAVLLGPSSADVIFTVANLIITDIFPPHTQAVAGATFNAVSQLGTAIGLAVVAVISRTVAEQAADADGGAVDSADALLHGYIAVFWAMFAWMLLATAVGVVGLRKVGKVGLKRD